MKTIVYICIWKGKEFLFVLVLKQLASMQSEKCWLSFHDGVESSFLLPWFWYTAVSRWFENCVMVSNCSLRKSVAGTDHQTRKGKKLKMFNLYFHSNQL